MKNVLTTLGLAVGLGLAASFGASAASASYPEKAIKIIVPTGAGGATDVQIRLLAPGLEKALGVPVAIINVPGGGTMIGNRQVKDAMADGYTVLATPNALMTARALGRADFDHHDLAPVAQTAVDVLVYYTRIDSPFASIDDALAKARAEPGSVTFGANIGAISHFAPLLLTSAAGVEFRYVQTGGDAGTIPAVLGKHVDLALTTGANGTEQLYGGELKPLMLQSAERSDAYPDVPTALELGYDTVFNVSTWWFMPKDTPADRVDAFASALETVMASDEIVSAYGERHQTIDFVSGDALVKLMDDQLAAVTEVATKVELPKK